jgi:hypothetical protein
MNIMKITSSARTVPVRNMFIRFARLIACSSAASISFHLLRFYRKAIPIMAARMAIASPAAA